MSIHDDDDLELADEYVLGLLSEEVAHEVELRMESDRSFALMVSAASERFASLDEATAPVTPSRSLWARIEAATAERAERAEAPRPQPIVADVRHPGGFWLRATAFSGVAASLVLAVALAWSLVFRFEPVVIAALVDDTGELVALVESDPDNRVRVTLLDDVELDDGRVMQVWTKPDPDGPPVSLGIIEELASRTLSLSGYPPPSDDQLYEITIERPGGSPTGLPTGRIVGKGLAKGPI